MDGLLDGSARLRETLVVGRSAGLFRRRRPELLELDLVDVGNDGLESVGDVVVAPGHVVTVPSPPYRRRGMPEGHVTHRVAKDHTPLLIGSPVSVTSPQGRFAADAELVDGRTLERIEAFGKHLFYHWDNDLIGHVHLGLFGKYRVHAGPGPHEVRGQVRMRLSTPVATVDLAGPTDCSIGTAEDRERIVARLGPDPLRRDGRREPMARRISASRQPIGQLLLDQRVVAGVGNVYRAEALFVLGIHPGRPGNDCSEEELAALWTTLTAMLRQGVKDRRIITVDRRRHPLPKGRPRRGDSTHVYHRDRCLECGSEIATVELGGRPCYYCPTCQSR